MNTVQQYLHDLVWDAKMDLWKMNAALSSEDREKLMHEVDINLEKIDRIVKEV